MKTKTVHRCRECGDESPRWLGRCPSCGEWGTLVESAQTVASVGAALMRPLSEAGPVPIGQVSSSTSAPMPTGVGELDRVLGGGLVPGSVTLLGGEPGMGKSTLLLQALGQLAAARHAVPARLAPRSRRSRCARVPSGSARSTRDLLARGRDVAARTSSRTSTQLAPEVLAIDSIQTVLDPDLPGAPGSVAQVRECALPARAARPRSTRLATVLVGHVTKDGALAGPRVLEHVVDTVLSFEGDRHHALRLLRALKHRFGPTDELGLFEMTERRARRRCPTRRRCSSPTAAPASAGSVVAAVLEGARPLLVEVQALVVERRRPMPRRSRGRARRRSAGAAARGARTARGRSAARRADVYASVAGGVRVRRARADLAVALAIAARAVGRRHRVRHRRRRRGRPRRRGASGAADRAPARRGGAARLHAARVVPRRRRRSRGHRRSTSASRPRLAPASSSGLRAAHAIGRTGGMPG